MEESNGSTAMPEAGLPEVGHEGDRRGQVLGDGLLPNVQTYSRAKSKRRGRPRKVQREEPPARGSETTPPKSITAADLFQLKFDWDRSPVELCMEGLKYLRVEVEKGATTISQRQINQADIICSNPSCLRPLHDGKWVSRFPVRDSKTGVMRIITSCSEKCHIINNALGPFATKAMADGVRLVRT